MPTPAERVVIAARALRMTNMKECGMVRSEYYRAIDTLDAALRDYNKSRLTHDAV